MDPKALYELLQQQVAGAGERVGELTLGLTWTCCRSDAGIGLAMSPGSHTRTLPWPGTLAGRRVDELAGWLTSWDPFEATVGMAAINSVINSRSTLPAKAEPMGYGNLAVFDHFRPHLSGCKVAVVGRYPGLEAWAEGLDLTVLERTPGASDLPDPACEWVLPESDWVFLTASSITNKTFPRLAELARDAHLVLMGPTLPWLAELAAFGVDFLAGVAVDDAAALRSTVAEGGGMRIFEGPVSYRLLDLRAGEMEQMKSEIAGLAQQRGQLKEQMERWYSGSHRGAFPGRETLEQVDRDLSQLDSRYKRLWDARFGKGARSPAYGGER